MEQAEREGGQGQRGYVRGTAEKEEKTQSVGGTPNE